MSNLRRIAGSYSPESPNMRRWSMIDWVRDQREARQQQPLGSQSVQEGRSPAVQREDRMVQSTRDAASHNSREFLDDIRRNPSAMDDSTEVVNHGEEAPVSIVNVASQNNAHSTMSIMSMDTHRNETQVNLTTTRSASTINPVHSSADDGSIASAGESSITRAREIVERRKHTKTTDLARAATQKTRLQVTQNLVNTLSATSSSEQPDLIPSTTEDSDDPLFIPSKEQPPQTLKEAFALDRSAYNPEEEERREAISYLLNYESMVLQQEAEEIATITYIRPLLHRLQALGRGQQGKLYAFAEGKSNESIYSDLCERTITYGELKHALDQLENQTDKAEYAAQDQQLMMILRMLTQKHSSSTDGAVDELSISWAELIHCYRVCVLGMSTLKHIPKEGSSKGVRTRAKDRILSQLSLFELPATKLLNEDNKFDTALDVGPDSNSNHKKAGRRRRNVGTLVALCVVASATFGFLVGSNYYAPTENVQQVGNFTGGLANRGGQENERQYLIEYCPAKPPSVRPDDLTSNFVDGSLVTNTGLPQTLARVPEQPKVESLPAADLNHAANTTTILNEKKTIGRSIAPSYQLAASAVVGASAAMGGPKIMVLSRAIGSALSLNSLGVLPATLVVVGAFAIGLNLAKGVRWLLQRLLKQS